LAKIVFDNKIIVPLRDETEELKSSKKKKRRVVAQMQASQPSHDGYKKRNAEATLVKNPMTR
jgi:hypothetical protein